MPLLLRWGVPVAVPLTLSVAVVSAGWLVLRTSWAKRLILNLARRILPRNLSSAGGESLMALRQLLKPAVLLPCTLIGVMACSMEGVCLWILLEAMHMDDVGITGAILAHTTAGLLGALSMMPGGLGTTEAGTVGLLTLQGAQVAAAIPATLLIRLMTLWFATALGIICLWGWKPAQTRDS